MLPSEIFSATSELILGMTALVRPVGRKDVVGRLPGILEAVDAQAPEGDRRGCLHAALWLLADELDRAHGICQDISTRYGSAWHAVMHRREGDFWNSKYWWRRAGGLRWEGMPAAVAAAISGNGAAASLMGCVIRGQYDPSAFVDLVEAHHAAPGLPAPLAAIQQAEWMTLFAECWRDD